MRSLYAFQVAALVAVTQSSPLQGQIRIEVTPRVGFFFPTSSAFQHGAAYKNQSSPIAGLSLTTFLSRFGFEVSALRESGAMTSSQMSACLDQAGRPCNPRLISLDVGNNRIWMVGASSFVAFPVRQSPVTILLAAGGEVISRSGEAYQVLRAPHAVNFGGVFGIGTRLRLWSWGALRADLQDHVSPCGIPPISRNNCPTQNEVTLLTGLAIPLTRGH